MRSKGGHERCATYPQPEGRSVNSILVGSTEENIMDPRIWRSWEEFLGPEVSRPRLIAASVYIAGFEALKDSIVVRIRDFFSSGFDESDDKTNPKYQSDVLARPPSPVYASLDWLKELNAIDASDLSSYERIKNCRNTLRHVRYTTCRYLFLHSSAC